MTATFVRTAATWAASLFVSVLFVAASTSFTPLAVI